MTPPTSPVALRLVELSSSPALDPETIPDRIAELSAVVGVLLSAEVRVLTAWMDEEETVIDIHPADWQLAGPLFEGPGWEWGSYGRQLRVSRTMLLTAALDGPPIAPAEDP